MGEENSPRVADPVVELNRTLCSLSFEIGGDGTEAEGWHIGLLEWGRVDNEVGKRASLRGFH